MNLFKLIAAFFVITQISACAVMTKNDCLSADWRSIGYTVGANGRSDFHHEFNRRQTACTEHGVIANRAEFDVGYRDGVAYFCRIENAVSMGVNGRDPNSANAVCPEQEYPGFSQAFADGHHYHKLRSYVQGSERELDRLTELEHRYQYERDDLKQKIHAKKLAEAEEKAAIERRKYLRRQIRSIKYDVENVRERFYEQMRDANEYALYLNEYFGTNY